MIMSVCCPLFSQTPPPLISSELLYRHDNSSENITEAAKTSLSNHNIKINCMLWKCLLQSTNIHYSLAPTIFLSFSKINCSSTYQSPSFSSYFLHIPPSFCVQTLAICLTLAPSAVKEITCEVGRRRTSLVGRNIHSFVV